jgi:hypothetical protein
MNPKSKATAAGVTLLAHPPERRRRQSAEFLSQLNGGCSCCCCCCLHSLGSLVGAVWGSVAASRGSTADKGEPPIKILDDEIGGGAQAPPVRMPVSRIYWVSVMAVPILVAIYCMVAGPRDAIREWILLALIVFLPLVLLGASLLSALVMACYPSQYQERSAWASLGRITAWTLIGAVIGGLVMLSIFLPH